MIDLSTPQGRAMHVLRLYSNLYNGMSKVLKALKASDPSWCFEMQMHKHLQNDLDEHLKYFHQSQEYWDLCSIACGEEVWVSTNVDEK